jgi:hypothetical protein
MAETPVQPTEATVRESTSGLPTTLTAWTLATTNTVAFILAALLPAYASGGLSDVLPSLNTTVGVVVFLALWLVVGVTTHWLLGHVDLAETSPGRLTLWAGACGALDGIVFLVGLVLALGVPTALAGPLELQSVVLIALIGAPIAAVVGLVVGVVAGVLDLLLLRAAAAVSPGR